MEKIEKVPNSDLEVHRLDIQNPVGQVRSEQEIGGFITSGATLARELAEEGTSVDFFEINNIGRFPRLLIPTNYKGFHHAITNSGPITGIDRSMGDGYPYISAPNRDPHHKEVRREVKNVLYNGRPTEGIENPYTQGKGAPSEYLSSSIANSILEQIASKHGMLSSQDVSVAIARGNGVQDGGGVLNLFCPLYNFDYAEGEYIYHSIEKIIKGISGPTFIDFLYSNPFARIASNAMRGTYYRQMEFIAKDFIEKELRTRGIVFDENMSMSDLANLIDQKKLKHESMVSRIWDKALMVSDTQQIVEATFVKNTWEIMMAGITTIGDATNTLYNILLDGQPEFLNVVYDKVMEIEAIRDVKSQQQLMQDLMEQITLGMASWQTILNVPAQDSNDSSIAYALVPYIPIYANIPNPDVVKLDRTEEEIKYMRLSFFKGVNSPHSCVGQRFATATIGKTIIELSKRYSGADNTRSQIETQKQMALKVQKAKVQLVPRK